MTLEPLRSSLGWRILDNKGFSRKTATGSMCSKLWRAEGRTVRGSQLILSKHSVASICFPANAIKIEAKTFLSYSTLFSKTAHVPVLCSKHVWVSMPFEATHAFSHPPGTEATPPLTCVCSNHHYTGKVTDGHFCRPGTTWIAAFSCLPFFLSPVSWLWKVSCHESCRLWEPNVTNHNRDRTRVMLC